MKLIIRRNVFETNSSSVHTLTIATKDEFSKFCSGEMVYDNDNCKLVNESYMQECVNEQNEWNEKHGYEKMSEEEADEYLSERFSTYDNYGQDFEYYEKEYTTEHGDTIVVFGYSGSDY